MTRASMLLIGTGCLMAVPLCVVAGQEKQRAGDDSIQTTVASSAVQQDAGAPVLQRRNPRYRLRPDDVLELKFAFSPQFNQTASVAPDGYITLASVGDLYVRGKSIPELVDALQAAYGTILNAPVITAELKNFEKPHFIAGGEVARPGRYDLRGDTTVAEAVQLAGGFTENSKHSQVLLFRRTSNDLVEVKKLNAKRMLKSGNLSEDLYLQDGDMLFVPKNVISKMARFLPRETVGMYFRPGSF